MGRSPNNSLMVACGDGVVVVATIMLQLQMMLWLLMMLRLWMMLRLRLGLQRRLMLGAAVLDESMHKSPVSFGVSGGDTKGKEAIMVVLENNPRPTFNNGDAGMLSTMVLIVGIM